MISIEAQQLKRMLKDIYVPVVDYEHMDANRVREEFEKRIVLEPIPEGVTYADEEIGGVLVEKISVIDSAKKVILHIHGGGMIMGHHYSGRFMLSHVAKLTERNAYSVNYRLCPEYSQPAAIEDCASVYKGLLEMGYTGEDIVLLGESAGGALVMSLCAYLQKNGIEMPAAACAISGSVDAKYDSPSMKRNISTEVVVNKNLPEMMKALYFKDSNPTDPVLSPIYADVRGWPPVYFHACKEEILLDESVRMYMKLGEAGVETELTIKEGLFHTYMMYNIPESYEAFEEIADFFKRH